MEVQRRRRNFLGGDNETDRDSESVDEGLDKTSRHFIAALLEKKVPNGLRKY